MRTLYLDELSDDRLVECPKGAFVSSRFLLASDGMGFSLHHTRIARGGPYVWHYKHHKEACYCVSGRGLLTDTTTGQAWEIVPGACYVLDDNKKHTFLAFEETVLISVFNPPCTGTEVHRADGSYAPTGEVQS